MIRKAVKKLRKAKKVRDLVPDTVVEKAAVLNPLAPPDPQAMVENVPRITNETIAEHREEVLSGARKFIYPLAHSKHRIIVVTSSLIVTALVGFLIYCTLGLYKLYQYNTFLYRVTQVVPFPIARTSGRFIDYENYLFELRHYVHYYQTQLQRNFSGDDRQQLLQFRKQALSDVINNAYVKILASQNKVSVSDKEVDARITEVRNQNRLGSNNKVFADVLHDYWGWSVNDFKRSLKDQILAEKVVAKLDSETGTKATNALNQLKGGADFAALAKSVSEDSASKAAGGDYGSGITKSNPNVPPQVVDAMFRLKPGQVSDVIDAGQTLEIVKVNTNDGSTVTAQHISFNLKDISTYITPLKAKQPVHAYVKL
jgi:hypothetical protein